MSKEWAPPINTLSIGELHDTRCQICHNPLYYPSEEKPVPNPTEITTCHHRFHYYCLKEDWCNNDKARNTLEKCKCPTCEKIFNCNTQLEDLSGQVRDKIYELQSETRPGPALVIQGPVAAQVIPVVDNLQEYLRANYRIDQIKKQFVNCIAQIVNDYWQPYIDGVAEPDKSRQEIAAKPLHYYFVSTQMGVANSFIERIKYNPYTDITRHELENLTTINNRLQDPAFMNELMTSRNSYFSKPRNLLDNLHSIINQIIIQCYTGIVTSDDQAHDVNLELVRNIVLYFMYYESNAKLFRTYLNLVPIVDTLPNKTINLIYFQRYFQCIVDLINSLLEVNYNAVFQVGGKQKKRLTKRRRTNKKRKTNRNIK